ncbi:hypothetical protein ACSQ67_010683 [Phaseolus vulgaris]
MGDDADAVAGVKIDVFWDEGMVKHDTGIGVFDTGMEVGFLEVLEKHPENSDRVRNMVSILKKGPISPYISWNSGRSALVSELLSFHTPDNLGIDVKCIEMVFKCCKSLCIKRAKRTPKVLCAGTFLNPGSWDAALLAAGTTLSAMKHLLDGHGKVAYALVRPPGHHAQPSQADGYCFLNNAGLAVQLALDSGCKKVAVIDIDVHYGNGTAEGFYRSNKVLTISLHMNHGSWGPSHPQSGSVDELGEGEGYGYNLNIPLPNGTGDKGYICAFNELVVPSIQKFGPDMIVLVSGQDSSAAVFPNSSYSCLLLVDFKFSDKLQIQVAVLKKMSFTYVITWCGVPQFDPNGRQCLTMEGYREIGRIVHVLAKSQSDGRLLIVQEGGYHITYSAYCLHATLEGVLNLPITLLSDPLGGYPEDETFSVEVIESIKNYQKDKVPFWRNS